ncbi:MAG: GNAT family N-acetyltransferase, partial [Desulfatitalea sp.]|nr:GNAT family N-acetyltransferase [Desulfatitalea sp.]NNK01722.1 GNAT family N-acetyltransferase [Desulfatitalea sp.]
GQPGADASARMLSAAPHQAVINGGPLSADAMQQVLNEMADTPNKVVVWTRPMPDQCPSPTAFKDITRLLYRAAESGCWNHVRLVGPAGNTVVDPMLDFASANPNIVHSWCRTTASASPFGDAQDHYPQQATRYGHTRPLPGLPLWRLLQDPPLLQVYLALNGVQRLASMYLIRQSKTWRCHPLGENLIYHFMPPDQLPKGYLDEICRMVAAGESVDTRWVRHNLQRAFLIGYAEENGVIAGNSSLKHPRETYIEAVSRQSGIDLRNYLERGYTSVRPAYRGLGIGTRLLEGLTRRSGSKKVFSIIAEDNIATRKMAIRNRTRRVATFYSHRAGKKVGVWIPERMVPAGVVLSGQPEVD